MLDRDALKHRRAGDFLLDSPAGAWLDYRWWTDPAAAPSFAAMVDIHRKPGYDPLELFLNPATRSITQDASLVRGSHGRTQAAQPIIIGPLAQGHALEMWQVGAIVESML
jgi:hypothetical protein